jgi:hypothetical protein
MQEQQAATVTGTTGIATDRDRMTLVWIARKRWTCESGAAASAAQNWTIVSW